MNGNCIIFNAELFRSQFPVFGFSAPGATDYTLATLQSYWDMATTFISDSRSGCQGLSIKQRTFALNLMTAHLLTLSGLIAKGQTPVVVVASSIDKIAVTLEPPPLKTQWQYWLSTTPYGQELLALLQMVGVGGLYIGGRPEISAFRRAGGWF